MGVARTSATALTLVALCAACATSTPAPAPSIRAEALRQEALWVEQDITNYEVTWLLLEGDDAAPDRYRSAHVLNNSVLDTRCPQERCPEAHLRDMRTIHDAFTLILDHAEHCDIAVLYHATLHFPTWIRANCSDAGQPDFRVVLRGFAPE